jgi:CRISPR-associated endoribonuclease Cas6
MTYTKQTYEINSAPKPYLFIGSKIRGAFGYALKEEVCVNHSFECKECFAAKECIFYKFYEEQNMTHDYRLDFKLHTQKYKFSLLLFGETQKENAVLHGAMMKSLEEYKEIIFKEKIKKLKTKKTPKVIKLEFLTPLRIKKQNRFATKEIGLIDILLSIHKRKQELQKLPFEKIEIKEDYKIVSQNFHYQELTRRSNKQNTRMQLGGLMGEIVIKDIDATIYDLLRLGEVIGVGKSTVFGLGKITIEEIA